MGACRSKSGPPADAIRELVPGVEFDTLGREWRCKFADGGGMDGGLINSKALEEAQKLLDENIEKLKAIDGVKRIGRLVCGGCKDFKIVITVPAAVHEAWKSNDYAPEVDFKTKLGAIEGITAVETQTYTAMNVYEATKQPETSPAEPAVKSELVPGVQFDTLAREWRCKFADGGGTDGGLINSKSLEEVQKVLDGSKPRLQALDGVASVTRIACGECKDFKVIVSMPQEKFKAWEAGGFAPEEDFLKMLEATEGITAIEKQTYTIAEF